MCNFQNFPKLSYKLYHQCNYSFTAPYPLLFSWISSTNSSLYRPQERPYVMVKEEKNLTGNARFEGFCIDLLKFIAGQVGFQYAIRVVPDHMYGVYNPETKEWNGIVRELMEKVSTILSLTEQNKITRYCFCFSSCCFQLFHHQQADLAVASMTINYARESVIDFTKPFMNLGIGILFKVRKRRFTSLNILVFMWIKTGDI